MKYRCFQAGGLPTNCYVISNSQGNAIVIDVAESGYEQISDYLSGEKLTLVAVLLTHGHFDHVCGVKPLLDLYYKNRPQEKRVPVYVGAEDLEYCEKAAYCAGVWGLKGEDCREAVALPDTLPDLAEKGFDVRILRTPGHSEGSVVYLIDDLMISGDTLFYDSVGRTDFPQGSPAKLRKSLELIKKVTGEYKVLPGHGRESTLQREKEHNIWLK